MKNHIIESPAGFRIYFRYNPILVERVKDLPGRKWVDDQSGKYWFAPRIAETEVREFAEKFQFSIHVGDDVQSTRANGHFDFSDLHIPPMPELTATINPKRPIFPYQGNGVQYILDKKQVIVGDQMGLGKTAQSIVAIDAADAFPCLVICPATIKENWRREWEMWTKRRALVLEDHMKHRWPGYLKMGYAQVVIVNYESLKKYFVSSIKESAKFTLNDVTFSEHISMFKSVIIDEAHRCKSTKTQQSKFTKGLCKDKEYVLALTGTPVVNKPDDLISQLSIINQLTPVFGGYKRFKEAFCDNDSRAARAFLNAQLRRHCFYRREKHEVLTQLPPKTRQVVYCDITTRHEYKECLDNLEQYLKQWKQRTAEEVEKSMRGELMVRINALKSISARGKMDSVFEWVDAVMEQGEKLVLFGHLHDVLDKIKARYPRAVSITGKDEHADRQIAIDRFQNDPSCQLIVCGIQAAGVGITLTASSRVAFVEFAWHPAHMDQAEDRCHRIGQTDNVQCTYFVGRKTVDEHIYKIIEDKRQMVSETIGAQDPTQVDILNDLMTSFEVNGFTMRDSNAGSEVEVKEAADLFSNQ